MARRTDYDIFCCMCGADLPYKRVMEQSPNGGRLRYIEEELGIVCMPCLKKLPDATAPVAHHLPDRERPERPGGYRREAPAYGGQYGGEQGEGEQGEGEQGEGEQGEGEQGEGEQGEGEQEGGPDEAPRPFEGPRPGRGSWLEGRGKRL